MKAFLIYESDLATIVDVIKELLTDKTNYLPQNNVNKVLLDSKQVSNLLGLTEKRLSKYRKFNKLKYIQQGTNYTVRYDPDDINEFIIQNKISGTSKHCNTK